jgi:nucleoside-diphosphate-sugar epimerase
MKSVIVTGCSGKAGRAAIDELLAHGYRVCNVDVVAPREQRCHYLKADLTDLGQCIDALQLLAGTIDRRRSPLGDADGVIHMAGIPAPGLAPDSNIFEEADYAQIPGFWDDPALRKWNLWSWVDYRDVGQACRLALEADGIGAEAFTIAAADTLMMDASAELMRKHFPAVPLAADLGRFDTLLSIAKAKRVLGYAPRYSWRAEA